mgnify:CR=1 FL=1
MKLDIEQRRQLADALQECLERDEGSSWRTGSHYLLIHLLGLFGHSAKSSQQAENMATRLLYED